MKTKHTSLFILFLLANINIVNAQWNSQTGNTSEDLHDTYFVNTSLGFAVGDNGVILKTTNGGTNWSSVSSSVTKNLNSIFFSSSLTGYIAGDDSTVLKTTDGGNNWTVKTSGTNAALLNSISFVDDNTGVAVGDNGLIIRTVDGGSNWSVIPSPTVFILHAVQFTSATIGYVIGANGTVLKTTDAGQNWIPENPFTTKSLYGINFLTDSVGYVTGTNGGVFKTIDGGATWTDITTIKVPNEWLRTIECPFDGICYAAGNNGLILKCFSDTIWSVLPSNASANIYSLSMLNLDTGYAAGIGGLILKTVNSGGNAVDENYSDENINMNIFPNPSADITTVSYNLQSRTHVTLEVYNLLGERMQTVFSNEEQTTGNHSFNLNLHQQGIYILKLTLNNNTFFHRVVVAI